MKNLEFAKRHGTDIPLQNLPIRTALGREIYAAFVEKGEIRQPITTNFEEIELRLLAMLPQRMCYFCNEGACAMCNGFDITIDNGKRVAFLCDHGCHPISQKVLNTPKK